ncbi:MAG: hypothetical protein ACI9K2_003384 [Myxococcota bacterium]|jgi:hypothetical protein
MADTAADTDTDTDADTDTDTDTDADADLFLGEDAGVLDGGVSGVDAAGRTEGSDGLDFVWDEPWSGTFVGADLEGSFSGGTFLFDNYSGTFAVSWTGM